MKEIRDAVEFYRNWKTGEVRDCEEVNQHKEALVRFAEIFLSRCQELNVVYGEGIDEAIDQMVVDKTIASKYIDEISREVQVLIDLAEKVLAAKMPEKKKHSDWDCGDAHCIVCEDRGYNRAIDDCRIAITGALLSEEELTEIIESVAKVYHIEHHRFPCPQEFASEIHRAQMEKLGGE
jgi:hypothetical protein